MAAPSPSRREFLAVATATALAMAARGHAQTPPKASLPSVCVFSKHLQFLNHADLAKTCKDLGLDGVDLTVRKGGHVQPDTVAADLPRAVETIRAQGLDVPMITTLIKTGEEPEARPTLDAASKLGIRYFRFGPYNYAKQTSPFDQLPTFAVKMKGVAALAAEFGMVGGYHNHSGTDYVGAALWDLHHLLREVASDSVGSNFDVGHATVEGGLGVWHINARLIAPYVRMLAVKDCLWEDKKPRWLTLGEGQVKLVEFLKIFRETGFAGPISLHFEYKTASQEALFEEIRKAAVALKAALAKAGYA